MKSTTAMAIDSPTANTVAVVDRTPIALSAPAKAMIWVFAFSELVVFAS